MQKKRATALQQEWGDKPCVHPAFAKEYDLGKRTGNYVCTQCGKTLTFREKAELVGVKAHAPAPAVPLSGGYMSKKSSRQIPDFSRQSSRTKTPGTPNTVLPTKSKSVTATPPRPKPQAAAGKSGQRGK
ncbi:MAG: hypothetical protein ABI229_01310 [Gemmatimonadaceae bacterium]